MSATKLDRRLKTWAQRFWPLIFWLLVWHMASVVIGHDILLVSPLDAGKRLIELAGNGEFWGSVGLSLSRIATGFASALAAGIVLAAASARLTFMRHLLAPLVVTIKSVPVASFVILILVWVSSEHLSVAISFLMAFPIVYTTMLEGIEQTDRGLLEMADIFDIDPFNRLRFIYASQVLPYFQAACSLSLGMCWKAGIAAEVIGLPAMSIGEHLYEAKVYLATSDLFAWTLVIICISILGETLFSKLVAAVIGKIERAL